MSFIKLLNYIIDKIIDLSAILGSVILAGITLLVGSDVIMRYFFNRPIENVFEISEHSLVFITFLVAPWVLKKDQHVKMDGILNQFNKKTQSLISTITSIIGAIVCLLLFIYGFQGTWDYFQRDLSFPGGMRIKQYPILSVIVLSYIMLSIQFIRRSHGFFKMWSKYKNES